jgi:hypothetical protein
MPREPGRETGRPAKELNPGRNPEHEQPGQPPGRPNRDPAGKQRPLEGAVLLLGGLAIALSLAAMLYALDGTLPQPTGAARFAIDAYRTLARTQIRGTIERLDHLPAIRVTCQKDKNGDTLITTSDRHKILVSEGVTRQLGPPPHLSHAQIFAESRLAGCVDPLYIALAARVINGRPVLRGRTRFAGQTAYRLQVGRDQPQLYLLSAQSTLTPLGIEYLTRRFAGTSLLLRNH